MVYSSWQEAFATIANQELLNFVRSELGGGQEGRYQQRRLVYRVDGKRRWCLNCRQDWAWVWQVGRFQGDVSFWKGVVAEPGEISPVKDGRSLSFRLSGMSDLNAFKSAVLGELQNASWIQAG